MKKASYLRKVASGMGFVLLIVSVVILQIPGTVGAQEEEFTLEDTVVTATKTGETDLQKTPISITVIDEEYLNNLGTSSLFELETFVSSFEFTHIGRIMSGWIRGVGTGSSVVMSGEAGIAYYQDGVYLDQGRGAGFDFLDLERIEILKGPQGVLFGGNATGGALNFITKKPTDELELMGRIEVGNYSTRRVDARIAGPLIEGKMRAGLTVMDAKHDSLIDNLSSERGPWDQNDWGIRGLIQFLPSDSVEITLSADYAEKEFFTMEYDRKPMYITDNIRDILDAGIAQGYTEEYLNPPDFWTVNLNEEDSLTQQENWGVSLHMKFDLPHDMTLRSITAHRSLTDDLVEDNDGWIHIHESFTMHQDSDQTSQELNLNGTWGRLGFLVGGFYLETSTDNPIMTWKYPDDFPPLRDLTVFNVEKENWAIFTNLSYAVTDKLNLSAGVRYSDEWKGFDFEWAYYLMLPDGSQGPLLFYLQEPTYSESGYTVWTPKFAIEYQASDEVFLFASYSEGFKGGMLWPMNMAAGISPDLDPEYVDTWELGVKTDWLDKRLRVNASVFTNDHTGAQTFFWEGPFPTFQNIGELESTGAELEVLARPIRGLTLSANVTYLDAEYAEFEDEYRFDDLGNRSVAGNQMAYIPEWKGNLGAYYTLAFEEAGFLTFGATIAYQDAVPTTPFPEDPFAWKDDYTIVNATIRYETQDGKWALEGYARNLFESKYYRDIDTDGYDTYFHPGDPRRIGVNVTFNY